MVFVAAFILFLMSLVNSYISSRITTPIRKLELSVNEIEKGNLNAKVDAEDLMRSGIWASQFRIWQSRSSADGRYSIGA
mgnify:CR=1 FL=1